ncbi:MAG: hypothetical protein HYW10_04215 [Candidatus Omnitrophica bacterium]|nr:hypothetical protein [Candidatus Omnitrophota bacterium]
MRKTPCIWRLFTGTYKVYVEDKALKDQLAGWQGCKLHCVYFNRHFQVQGWDLIFPSRLYDRVAKLCGLPSRRKSQQRIANAQQLGLLAKTHNHLGLPAPNAVRQAGLPQYAG